MVSMPAPHLAMQKSPLDPTLLSLRGSELDFFKAQTGIEDSERLRQHILQVQAEAYAEYPYPCIRRFLFTKFKMARLPGYRRIQQLGKTRKNAIFLDVGCCFGHDIRAAIADGYPTENMIGLDLKRGLWDLGYKLFNSTPATFPVPFVEGDIFDSEILDTTATPTPVMPPLHCLESSLTVLLGHVSVIHATMLFHLFSEDRQLELARRLGALLSPLPGSIIFGNHVGLKNPGIHPNNSSGKRMFCHSPESWRALWEGILEKGSIEVDVELVPSDTFQYSKSAGEPSGFYGLENDERYRNTEWLNWCIKRI